MDSFDLGSDSSGKAGENELQEFLLVEKQKAQFNAQVRIIRYINRLRILTSKFHFCIPSLHHFSLLFCVCRFMSSMISVGTNASTSLERSSIPEQKPALLTAWRDF